MPVGVGIQADDLADLVRSLRGMENGKALRKQLVKDIRTAAKPIVPAVRAKARALPSQGVERRREGPGLRDSVAKATRLHVQTSGRFVGVTIRVDPKKMPPGMHNLPSFLEGAAPFQRWEHPLFKTGPWYRQQSHPYFYSTVERFQPAIQQAVAGAVDSLQRQINA